ncbi:MAG: RHS repeat protein [Bdellovibrionaceae bacterium]|nr:RHS repeat protein [Pseudobdellovibrionaceae bacterium]
MGAAEKLEIIQLGDTESPFSDKKYRTEYTYDGDGVLTQIARPNGTNVTYSYLPGSVILSSISNGTGTYSFTGYDSNGKANTITSPYDLKNEFTRLGPYLKTDKLTNLSIPRVYGTVEISYKSNRWLPDVIKIKDTTGATFGSVTYNYDKDGLVTQVGDLSFTRSSSSGQITAATLGGISESYTYDSYGAIATYTVSYGGSPLYSYSITRDLLGRIDEWTETVQGVATTEDYIYDSRGRLSEIKIGGVTQSSYNYSFNSNRTSGNVRGTNFSATFDAQDRIKTWKTLTYSYNANGELTSKVNSSPVETTSYSWDFMGQLKQIDKPNGDVVKYRYDGKQRKAQVQVNGTAVANYLYQDDLRAAAR